MRHGSLFSGIGGFDLAAEWMGWENVFHCEWNPFGQKVLKYYWPNAISYGDITKTDFTIHRGNIDILTGGFPCQPFSTAGVQRGEKDERFLFYEMLRAIREIRPRFIVGENVYGMLESKFARTFHEICSSVESEGYEIQPIVIPATAVEADHERYRTFFIANSNQVRNDTIKGTENCYNQSNKLSDKIKSRNRWRGEAERFSEGKTFAWSGGVELPNLSRFPTEPPVCCQHDGLPCELDGITFQKHRKESLMAYGNAIVPQVVYQIFKAIEATA